MTGEAVHDPKRLLRTNFCCYAIKEALTEDERYAVADHVVDQLKPHGDPWHLSDEARPKTGPTT